MDQLEQTSFTYDCEMEVNGGSNVDRTLAQSTVSSFDQGEIVWRDRTLRGERPDAGCQRPVDSNKVLERENRNRTCPVSADPTLCNIPDVIKYLRR